MKLRHTQEFPQNVVFLDGLQNQVPAMLEIATNAIEANKKDPENNLPFKAIIFMSSKNEVALTREWLQQLKVPGTEGQRSIPGSHHIPCRHVRYSRCRRILLRDSEPRTPRDSEEPRVRS